MSLGLRESVLTEARLEDAGSGLAPVTEGWFVVNVRDAEWFTSETRGAACWFANEYGEPPVEFEQLGINADRPRAWPERRLSRRDQSGGVPRSDRRVQAARRGRGATPSSLGLLPLASWTEHAFVGAGDRPCVILMVGAHVVRKRYPVSGSRALWGERGEGDIRSGAGLCDGRSGSARAAAVLVASALGLGLFKGHPARGSDRARPASDGSRYYRVVP